jgi:hypothetical protein
MFYAISPVVNAMNKDDVSGMILLLFPELLQTEK